MSDFEEESVEGAEDRYRRCPNCDTLVSVEAARCLMCGQALLPIPASRPADLPEPVSKPVEPVETLPAAEPLEKDTGLDSLSVLEVDEVSDEPIILPLERKSSAPVVERVEPAVMDAPARTPFPEAVPVVMRESLSPAAMMLTIFVLVVSFIGGNYLLRFSPAVAVVYLPTSTPFPPTPTFTTTPTPSPTETVAPTETPTITLTPSPTNTPQPPRSHVVSANETLFGLGLFYGITADSIAEANGLPPGSGIQVSQNLLIPWPTATPPLVPVAVEIGGETIIADPTDCLMYEIQSGDTLFGIAARNRVDLRALLAVNRLTDQVVLQPGDVICIPQIIRSGVLPPTPGPTPTPTETPPPPGPQLLYPIQNAVVDPPEGPLVLQWAAVKDLGPTEWYMVEVTNLTQVDSHPMRGFTRRTAFRVPTSWRPSVPETHLFRWRITIVQVTGERADGSFIYTFGGGSSEQAFFTWLGAVLTPE